MMLLKESSKIWDMSLNLPEAELMKNEQKKVSNHMAHGNQRIVQS